MMELGVLLLDELLDIAIATAISQLPAIVMYVQEHQDEISEKIHSFVRGLL